MEKSPNKHVVRQTDGYTWFKYECYGHFPNSSQFSNSSFVFNPKSVNFLFSFFLLSQGSFWQRVRYFAKSSKRTISFLRFFLGEEGFLVYTKSDFEFGSVWIGLDRIESNRIGLDYISNNSKISVPAFCLVFVGPLIFSTQVLLDIIVLFDQKWKNSVVPDGR